MSQKTSQENQKSLKSKYKLYKSTTNKYIITNIFIWNWEVWVAKQTAITWNIWTN